MSTPAVRPEFTARMGAELVANSHKGNWDQWRPTAAALIDEIWHHQCKLRAALLAGDQARVAEHAADVALYCMKAHEMYGL